MIWSRGSLRQTFVAVAVASLLAGCTPSQSGKPSASPSAEKPRQTASVHQPLVVPATTPVVLFHDPANGHQVDGVTWDGTTFGRVSATGGGAEVVPNPTATVYAEYDDRGIYDRTGRLLTRPFNGTQPDFGTWADDGQHYCQMVAGSSPDLPGTLVLGMIGEQPRNIAQLGPIDSRSDSAAVAACSVERDRAVVFGAAASAPTLWVVMLSTGRVLWQRSYAVPQMHPNLYLVASRDGQYIAENRQDWDHPVDGHPAYTATVLGADGSILTRVVGQIDQFSWDGSLAVVNSAAPTYTYPGAAPPSVLNWRNGQVIWKAPEGVEYWNALPEPGGRHLAVAVLSDAGIAFGRGDYHAWTYGLPPQDLYAVGPDGQAFELLEMTSVAFPTCLPNRCSPSPGWDKR